MASIFDWSGTASSNTTVDGVNIATGMPVQNTDNAFRTIMGVIRQTFSGTLQNFLSGAAALGLSSGGTGATTAADARTNLGLGTLATKSSVAIAEGGTGQATAAAALAALMAGAVSGNASAGTINFGVFKLTWKQVTANPNTTTAVTYHSAFTSWSNAWCAGGVQADDANSNDPFAVSGSGTTTGCTLYSAANVSVPVTVFAIGV